VPPAVALTRKLCRPHWLLASALALTAAVLVPASGATATPDKPKPTVASVTARLDTLAEQSEALAEQFNATQIEVARQQKAVTQAQRNAAAADANYETARAHLAEIAVAQYEGGSFSRTGAILSSDSGQSYLDNLQTQDQMASHTAGVVSQLDDARTRAENARKTSRKMLVGARTKQEALAHKRASVIAQTEKFQTLLATLTAAQRQAYTTRGAPTTQQIQMAVNVHSGSAAAQKAINFALAQVGKPYVFGAAGPDAWDCSGLTMAAWAKGGVSLPHFAASQYNFGRHVGFGELQPGDLVFLYSDIHHVEIYIGDGLAVSAPEPGQNVKIVQVANSRSNFYGATRLT
jgi:peptidoglycan DL-endopeptidase CwlO